MKEPHTKIIENRKSISGTTTIPKRKGWEKAFKKMAENGDDSLMMPDVFNDDNTDEWTWPQ